MNGEHDKVKTVIRLRNQRPLNLEHGATALIVVDVQRNFVDPAQPFMRAAELMSPGVTDGYRHRLEHTVMPNISRLVERFRAAGLPIAYTGTGTRRDDRADLPGWLHGFDEMSNSLLGEPMWPPAEDPSWDIDHSIAPDEADLVVNKTSSGAFATTDLERSLRQRGVESLVVTGLTTDVCVSTTAREAADRSFDTVVAADACTTLSEAMHTGSLEAFALAFGSVRPTEAILAGLPTAARLAV